MTQSASCTAAAQAMLRFQTSDSCTGKEDGLEAVMPHIGNVEKAYLIAIQPAPLPNCYRASARQRFMTIFVKQRMRI